MVPEGFSLVPTCVVSRGVLMRMASRLVHVVTRRVRVWRCVQVVIARGPVQVWRCMHVVIARGRVQAWHCVHVVIARGRVLAWHCVHVVIARGRVRERGNVVKIVRLFRFTIGGNNIW